MTDLTAMVERLRKENARLRGALRREIEQSAALTEQYNIVLAERDAEIKRLREKLGVKTK